MNLNDFTVGDRVQLHPATDFWMSGDRYGTVTNITRQNVLVKMDRSFRVWWLDAGNILEIVESAAWR